VGCAQLITVKLLDSMNDQKTYDWMVMTDAFNYCQ